ncbi:MAG: hypothetical protein IID44_22310 [Planctomycetes bacterium]|nr:hypothetical protein [Planctomycetota bacterium]
MTSFRWEEELRQSFLKRACPTLWSRAGATVPQRTFIESTCSDGRADWVWAGIRCDWPEGVSPEIGSLLRQPACSRILATLKPKSPRREEYFQWRSGVAPSTFRRHLSDLVEHELVSDLGGNRYILGPAFAEPQIEICSFEFKLDNWKRAFHQAKRYRTFSHRVFVVMPSQVIARLRDHLDAFRRFNIGLISHDSDGSSERIVASRKREPISRNGFIQALGSLLAQEDV